VNRAATALLALLAAAPALAQDTAWTAPWKLHHYPYVAGAPNDAPLLAYTVRWASAARHEARVRERGAFALRAGATWTGSWSASARYEADRVLPGWRLDLGASAFDWTRWGYYGTGILDAGDLVEPDAYYRVKRRRLSARAEATRTVAASLRVALAGELYRADYRAPDDAPSLFASEAPDPGSGTDAWGRLALVLDTRDREHDPRRGLLLEAGAQVASGGGGYERLYGIARGWAPIGERVTVAARVLASQLYGTPPLDALVLVPAWRNGVDVLGGELSQRGLASGRYAVPGVLAGTLELRAAAVRLRDLGGLGVVGFVDVGQPFATEKVALDLDGARVAGGGGLVLTLLRAPVLGLWVASGGEGANLALSGGWVF